ncbi:MAG: (Fe-S)-binding protein [Desulfotignum sp.]|nr:(Fe-S)-binding protein [Desulfotignum sp.]MCF8114065.1 (Fe-S)-binding protein [Desulfotignum sp.]MCF8126209.1 (Fe-S)-binding protein [Desulfotignum sp.]
MTDQPIQNCGKCGLCLSVCPVYQVLKQEQASPRARLQLIKAFEKKDLSASPLLKDLVSRCLMCGACKVACPSGINHYAKFMEMRRKMAKSQPDPPAIRSLVYLLAKEYRLRMGAGLARIGRRLTPGALEKKYKIGTIPVSRFPEMNRRSFRSTLPRVAFAKDSPGGHCRDNPRGRVVYFTGCATNFLFADTGQATVNILTRLGYEVVIPDGQTCCGIPMMFHGARDQAVENMAVNLTAIQEAMRENSGNTTENAKDAAAENCDAMDKACDEAAKHCDAVIVDCTTCGAALKDEYPALMNTLDPSRNKALAHQIALAQKTTPGMPDTIAAKTRDILSFLHDHMDDLAAAMKPTTPKHKVIYHAPCHSKNSFNSLAKVLDLLKALPCFDYIPVPDEAACCGGGGTFFYEYPDISRKMMAKKLISARAAGADFWLTDCPVCRINLHGSLSEKDNLTVVHPVTLISKGLGS